MLEIVSLLLETNLTNLLDNIHVPVLFHFGFDELGEN